MNDIAMQSAPRHDWKLYQERCRDEHIRWLQGLTPAESLAIYESMHNWAAAHAVDDPLNERLEDDRWQAKLALRKRMCQAFEALDRFRNGRLHSTGGQFGTLDAQQQLHDPHPKTGTRGPNVRYFAKATKSVV